MTVPFIVGAALAGVLYFGGVGESVVPAAEGIRVAGAGASGVIYLDESVGPENGLPPVSQPRATTGSIERISAPVAAARRPADRLIGAMDAPESSESLTPPPSEPGRHPMDAVAQIAPAAVSTEATFLEPDPPGADAAHDSQPADVADAPLGTIKAGESTQFEAAATLEWLLQGDDERGFVGPEQ